MIAQLEQVLVTALNSALSGAVSPSLNLSYPIIIDPEKPRHIRYKGFNCFNVHNDLEISGYINDLLEKKITKFDPSFLEKHRAHECTASGEDEGLNWKIKECLIYETDLSGQKYILSGDRWYCIDKDLVSEVNKFFKSTDRYIMPPAKIDENEEKYNNRIATLNNNLLCLDRKTIKPTGANSSIESCDFLSATGEFIHVKDQTSSSRLSHLFNQGVVSARVMKTDIDFRKNLRKKIEEQEAFFNKSGYKKLILISQAKYKESNHKIVYAVIRSGTTAVNTLPFFSLVTFRYAASELRALGYSFSFSWISKPNPSVTKAPRKKKSTT